MKIINQFTTLADQIQKRPGLQQTQIKTLLKWNKCTVKRYCDSGVENEWFECVNGKYYLGDRLSPKK
jgi:hypothetical protein